MNDFVQSRFERVSGYTMLFACLFCSWMCWLVRGVFQEAPFDVIGLAVAAIFWAFAFAIFRILCLHFKQVRIDKEQIDLVFWLGLYRKTIAFDEINQIQVRSPGNKQDADNQYTIQTHTGATYTLHENYYDNFYEILGALSRGKVKFVDTPVPASAKSRSYEWGIVALALGACLAGIVYFYYQSVYFELDKSGLVEVELTLAREVVIEKGSKGRKNVVMPIREYPDFNFDVPYGITNTAGLIERTGAGSKVFVLLNREAYEQKLARIKPISFWNEHLMYQRMAVYGLRTADFTFLSPTWYEASERKDYVWGYGGLLVILVYLLYLAWKDTEADRRKGKKPYANYKNRWQKRKKR